MARREQTAVYYKAVPGSRDLSTAAADSEKALKAIENAGPEDSVEIEYKGEKLRSGGPTSGFPIDLYDSIMPGLDALEQAVLGHLSRLSLGRGADWVRVGKKELSRRTGLSPRRLLKALSGLAEKRIVKPLHRDINGTLYKMYTVNIAPSVSAGARQGLKTSKPLKSHGKIPKPREKTLESPINEEAFPGNSKILTMREIAGNFFKIAGKRSNDVDMDSALAQITYLLEDGFTREEVMKTAAFLAQNFGKKADISKLPYYINQVVSDQL